MFIVLATARGKPAVSLGLPRPTVNFSAAFLIPQDEKPHGSGFTRLQEDSNKIHNPFCQLQVWKGHMIWVGVTMPRCRGKLEQPN